MIDGEVLIRVLLADDHQLMREGLKALFVGEPDIAVVAEADNGRTAVRLALEVEPDVVVMDVAMPDLNGIEATRQILARLPRTKVVALSMHTDKRYVVEILRAGANAYLVKDSAFKELIRAVRAVMTNNSYLSPSIAAIVVNGLLSKTSGERSPLAVLSSREREVLQLLTEGHTTREIAERLHLSVKTIDTHRQNLMRKLNIHSVVELTKFAIREGLTDLGT